MRDSAGLRWSVAVVLLLALLPGCGAGSDGDDGARGPDGPAGPPGPPGPEPDPDPTPTELAPGQPLPGILLEITALSGASGAGGAFQVGDTLSVTFTLARGDGEFLDIDELNSGRIYVSGPTTNYQRVLPSVSDLRTLSVRNTDGSWTYTFAAPIPAVYAAPYNDTASFGAADGELAGQALLSGTYTVGIEVYKTYTEGEESFRDPQNATRDFLFGTAAVLAPREVVAEANCNRCHEELQAHGGGRRDPKLCVLCHTSGAEDRNVASAAGGTPGVSVEFSVMIHRIHNGRHLPSVLGVATLADGSRTYGATPVPYQIVGFNNSVNDFSRIGFPAWPNLNIAMPRDPGYSLLTSGAKALDDEIRRGVTSCDKCHGDPDGPGGASAPAQGGNAYTKQTRRACGSCHDDVDWTKPYTVGGASMPAQADDAACLNCHPASGSALSPLEGHLHPLKDPVFNPGVVIAITGVTEGGTNDGDGRLEAGETPIVAFTVKNDAGADVPANTLGSMSAVVSGPTTNAQMLLNTGVTVAALGAGPGYSTALPQGILLDWAGTGTAAAGETFTTSRAPHWNVTGSATTVQTAAPTATTTTLAAAAPAFQNWIDVASSTGFLRNDVLVVEPGTGNREYLKIQTVEGNRLWLNSLGSLSTYVPFLRKTHASGSTVTKVTLTNRTLTTHYTLNATTGQVTEVADSMGTNDVIVNYTANFVLPAAFPPPYNDTTSLDGTMGEWTGKVLAPGTYTVTLWGGITRTWSASGENTSYNGVSAGGTRNFLVGTATAEVPWAVLSSGTNCYRCHDDLYLHGGGRRGFDTCLSCHGTAGFEDRPRYVAPNAPESAGVQASFREMIHKIHTGKDLPDVDTYGIVGFSSTAYPNNYSFNLFDEVSFPVFSGGVRNCAICHGDANSAWKAPSNRDHPSQPSPSVRSWRVACGSCHSAPAAHAHMDVNTAPVSGVESCAVCHGTNREFPVEKVHRVR